MTADHIAFHALEHPDAVALVHEGRPITYAEFARDLRKLTIAAAELGVPRGGSVAVGAVDLYTHWLLLLAFERLGVVTASFSPSEGDGATPLLRSVDLVLAEPHFAPAGAGRHHAITGDWLTRALALEAERELLVAPQRPEEPVRILRTSGTTGQPKRIQNSRLAYDAKITRWIVLAGFNVRSRLLITMSLNVQGMYSCASACLRAGGTVIAATVTEPGDIARAILEHGVTVLILAPVQIKQVLDALPDGFVKPQSLMLCSFGAAVSTALRERALATLATEVIDMYGSNETGFISSIGSSREEGISTIWPGARVEVVDERDQLLPYGQMGRIRARTPEMIQSYPNDPETTHRMFKDGWFYPGDFGVLHGPRRLQIVGRSDDLLNLGGLKLPPEVLEQAIVKSAAVGDVGACSIRNADGIEQVLIGLVDAQGEDRELLARVTKALSRFYIGEFRIVKLRAIPRNANGKIQRDLLRSAIIEAVRSSRPARL